MSEHTPGPWAIQNDDLSDPRNDTAWVTADDARKLIADQLSPADARLIAAAPDLLAAGADVIRLGDEFDDMTVDYPDGWWQAFEQLRAAIVKATGKEI